MIPQYEPFFGSDERDALFEYMQHGGVWLTEHTQTSKFEGMVADAANVQYASAVNNGTVAISLALLALGVNPGDKVVVPDLTMIATASAAMMIGCEPVLCDVDSYNLCLDLDRAVDIARSCSARAVIYVPLNGRSHPADRLGKFKAKLNSFGCHLVEDAAQSLGSFTPDGISIGSIGEISTLSFSPHKIVSTGQGGAVLTNDFPTYEKVERLKDFGRIYGGDDIHDHFGINAKFTDLQAVVGVQQIKRLPANKKNKKQMRFNYFERLTGTEVVMMPHCSLPWFMDIFVPRHRRDDLVKHLFDNGIGSRPMYPALHTQGMLRRFANYPADFPVATAYSEGGLWLPSSINITVEEIEKVCNLIVEFMSK